MPYNSLIAEKAQEQRDANSAYQVHPGAIPTFIEKFSNWQFNFPANHLWTVEIQLHNNGDKGTHGLLQLYTNIETVNTKYAAANGTRWQLTQSSNKSFANNFLNYLQSDKTAFFLAQGVSYDNRRATVSDNIADSIAPQSGFLRFGTIENGAMYTPQARIQFLETNWDIGEILFDKWIAAITQQGLIEDSSLPNIKADIYIYQYAPSIPQTRIAPKSNDKADWQLRKITKLIKAIPLDRTALTLTNAALTAPNTTQVTFSFLDYQIEYTV